LTKGHQPANHPSSAAWLTGAAAALGGAVMAQVGTAGAGAPAQTDTGGNESLVVFASSAGTPGYLDTRIPGYLGVASRPSKY